MTYSHAAIFAFISSVVVRVPIFTRDHMTMRQVRHDISTIQSQGWPGTISSATTLNVNNVCHQPEDDNCVLSCVKVNVIKLWNEREIDLWSQLTPSSCSTYSVSINDLTIGWQNLNLLSHLNATLAPQARQPRASGENLNHPTLAPQARPSGEILNYLLRR